MDGRSHVASVLLRLWSCGGGMLIEAVPDGDVHSTTGAGSPTALHSRMTSSPSLTFWLDVTYATCGTVQVNELSGIVTMCPRNGVTHSWFNPCLVDVGVFSQSRYQSISQLQCSGFPVNMNVPILSSKGLKRSSNNCTLFDCMFSVTRPPSAYGLSSLASREYIRLFETLR